MESDPSERSAGWLPILPFVANFRNTYQLEIRSSPCWKISGCGETGQSRTNLSSIHPSNVPGKQTTTANPSARMTILKICT
jgi:hypothetical protein